MFYVIFSHIYVITSQHVLQNRMQSYSFLCKQQRKNFFFFFIVYIFSLRSNSKPKTTNYYTQKTNYFKQATRLTKVKRAALSILPFP